MMNSVNPIFNAQTAASQKQLTLSSPQRAKQLTFTDQGTIYKIEINFEGLRQLEATFRTEAEPKINKKGRRQERLHLFKD